MATFKILGFSDSETTCDRCGRNELKGTYTIQTDTGDVYHLGSICIRKGYEMTQKELTIKLTQDTRTQVTEARQYYNNLPEIQAIEAYLQKFNAEYDACTVATKPKCWEVPEYMEALDRQEEIKKQVLTLYPLVKMHNL